MDRAGKSELDEVDRFLDLVSLAFWFQGLEEENFRFRE
jgi:hypothetical protein